MFTFRMKHIITSCAVVLGLGAGIAVNTHAQAAAYPDRPIQVIIPNPPGGGTDTLGRLVLNAAAQDTGWQLVAMNRPGAAGAIGLEQGARAEPDGYTIVLGETSNLSINPSLYKNLKYDPGTDFAPIISIGTVPLVMVVGADAPYKTVDEFLAAARKGDLILGSAGKGTVGHLAGAMMESAAGIQLLHAPYKGAAPALNDLIGGRVSVFFGSYPSVRSYLESGRIRALAVTSSARADYLAAVPTLAESGLPGFEAVVWYGFVAPAGMDKARVDVLANAFEQTLTTPAMRKRLNDDGVTVDGRKGAAFASFIAAETKKWGDTVVSAKLQAD